MTPAQKEATEELALRFTQMSRLLDLISEHLGNSGNSAALSDAIGGLATMARDGARASDTLSLS